MKKLFFAVFALAALSLLAPSTGFAQTAWNQIGIYTDQTGTPESANAVAELGVEFFAYLVLTNPVNESFGAGNDGTEPVTAVDGFECKITLPASSSFFQLGVAYPAQAVNIGNEPNYYVGFATSVAVTGTSVVLATFRYLILAPGVFDVFLSGPDIPSLGEGMAFVDGNDGETFNLQAVFPSTSTTAVPVFSINGTNAIATEAQTFGGVKSLFR